MLNLINPVGTFYLWMQEFFAAIPLAIRLFVFLYVGVIIVMSIIKSMRGA